MIHSFNLENQRTKTNIAFGQDFDYNYLFEEGGIDWGNIEANHNTYTFPNQIGSNISSSKMKERQVTIQGYVYSKISIDDIKLVGYEEARKEAYERMLRNKKELNNMINPNDYVRMIVGDYFIEGKPDQAIVYGATEESNNDYFCKFFISLYCSNPMFRKENKVESKLKESTPYFHFPLVLKPHGIIMSYREEYLIIPAYNEGNNKVGGIITIESKGDVVNPEVENINTGEKIKINKTLSKGEKIIINTNDGSKSVVGIKDYQEENYFRYWDFDNTWFKFEEGTTLVGYSTDDSNESQLIVSIEIYPEKFALEEM